MEISQTRRRRFASLWRAVVETALLVFLLYSVRLMGEFTSTNGQRKSLALALSNIFTGFRVDWALNSRTYPEENVEPE